MAAVTLGFLAFPTLLLIPVVVIVWFGIDADDSGSQEEMNNLVHCHNCHNDEFLLSFDQILKTHHDDLNEIIEMHDARELSKTPHTSQYNQTQPFAITIVELFASIEDAKERIRKTNDIPFYVMQKILNDIDFSDNRGYCDLLVLHTIFASNHRNTSSHKNHNNPFIPRLLASGYQYDLTIQKTNAFDYVLIFSVYGIEFPADNKLGDPNKLRRNRDAEIRKKKAKLSRISCIANSESMSSMDEMYKSPVIIDQNLEEYIEDLVDQWFEHHIQYDTLPKINDALRTYT